jgi:sirohydrochlorin cobaltochelatase
MNPAGDFAWEAHTGLLLVGHGSRERIGIDEFLATAALVAEAAGSTPVEPCFLEFAAPSIADAFEALVRRGARRVCVVPLLLFAAGHARQDIPRAVAHAARRYPEVQVAQSDHLGCHDAVLELSHARYDESLRERTRVASADTALVLVGRGSHDAEATAEMRQFAALRARCGSAQRVYVGFLAMADPPLESVLEEAAASGAKRIVVQPHLLFGGVLVDRIGAMVARVAARHPHPEWVVAGHLGTSPLIAAAVIGRAQALLSAMPGA